MQRLLAPTLIVATHGAANPMNKVFELMDECKAKIEADGVAEAKAYKDTSSGATPPPRTQDLTSRQPQRPRRNSRRRSVNSLVTLE